MSELPGYTPPPDESQDTPSHEEQDEELEITTGAELATSLGFELPLAERKKKRPRPDADYIRQIDLPTGPVELVFSCTTPPKSDHEIIMFTARRGEARTNLPLADFGNDVEELRTEVDGDELLSKEEMRSSGYRKIHDAFIQAEQDGTLQALIEARIREEEEIIAEEKRVAAEKKRQEEELKSEQENARRGYIADLVTNKARNLFGDEISIIDNYDTGRTITINTPENGAFTIKFYGNRCDTTEGTMPPNTERPYTGWRDQDIYYTLIKAAVLREGLDPNRVKSPEFLDQIVALPSLSRGQDQPPVTMKDFILAYRPKLAKQLGIEGPMRNEAYRRIFIDKDTRQEEHKQIAITRLKTQEDVLLDGTIYSSDDLVNEIENDTEIGKRAILHEMFAVDTLETALQFMEQSQAQAH